MKINGLIRLNTYRHSVVSTSKPYTFIVCVLPIISVYASGIGGFTLGDIALLLFFAAKLFERGRANTLKVSPRTSAIVPLILAIPLISLVSAFTLADNDTYSIIIRVIRRVFYYLCVVVISSDWFNFDYAKKVLVTAGKIGAIYMFVQYAAYYLGHVILHGYLPFLPVYHEHYSSIDYAALYQNMFRPTSFLLEPAHIARYLVLPLIILLFDKSIKNRWLWAALISAAILASTSGIGFICVGIVWPIWIFYGVAANNRGKKVPLYYLALYALLAVAVIVALSNKVVQSALYRITNSNLLNVNTAGGARFRGYVQFFQLDTLHKIIGMGYGSTPNTAIATWFSGASYMLYGTGIIGFIVCVIMFVRLYMGHVSPIPRVVCVIYVLLFLTDDSFMSQLSVLYMSLICMGGQFVNRREKVKA